MNSSCGIICGGSIKCGGLCINNCGSEVVESKSSSVSTETNSDGFIGIGNCT